VTAFQAAYALGMLAMGRLMDGLGVRRGLGLGVALWSAAAAAHGLASGVGGLAWARFALGAGESAMFPAALKAIAEWFPRRERALATGLFNSGTNLGAILCPLAVPWVAVAWGWRAAFVATGALGLLWLAAWLSLYAPLARSSRVTPGERALIQADAGPPLARAPWLGLLAHRQLWALAAGKFMTDPIWWLYLFWVPDFLHRNHGLQLLQLGPPLVAIYLISDVGSIAGGWLSSSLLRRGWSASAARKTALLVCALGVTPILLAARAESLWAAVALLGLATASHQGFSANLFTLATDLFPERAVGSAVGIAGMAGAVGGMLIAQVAGHVLELTGSYAPLFVLAASAYLLALGVIHALVPRLEPARFPA
jgi:ACS family hexuronate transporter-like MFS transporter